LGIEFHPVISVKRVKGLKEKGLFFSPGATKPDVVAPNVREVPEAVSTAGEIPVAVPGAAPEHRQLAVFFLSTGTLVKSFQIFYTASKSLSEPVAWLKTI
jgi:hypothetical protein